MDTGWLLVGAAGICGGLALALVGAGVATSPVLLPLGVLVGLAGYLAWVAGSSRVVATVYEEVGDPERSEGTGRTGRRDRHDPPDPDGNWGTAADGGRTASDDGSTGFEHGTGSGIGDDSPRATTSGVDDIWDAGERDRVGGWDDWEWTDRRWREFEREYDIDGTGGTDRTDRGPGAEGSQRRRRTHSRAREDSGARTTGADRRDRRGSREHERGPDPGSGDAPGADERAADGRAAGRGNRATGRRSRGGRRRRRPDRQAVRARDVLGIDRDADRAAIRAAYRDRVKETHPDRGGDPEAFKRVQWAYEYLTED